MRQLSAKADETHSLNKEIANWKDVVDRMTSENVELKSIMEDLELRNRKLVDKLNEQIYNQATDYKQRTLQALVKNDSPTKIRQAL